MAENDTTVKNNEVEDEEEVNDNPIEQVRLTVPITDDPTLPCLSFRTWFLGIVCCLTLSFVNQFLQFRQNPVFIPSLLMQFIVLMTGRLVLMTGRFMERILPGKLITIPLTKWSFSLNPGPFNIKEHCLINKFISFGFLSPHALDIFITVKAFYHRKLDPFSLFLLTIGTQMIGYGWAGIYRFLLVDSPYMWWPTTMVQVSLFHTLHDIEIRKKGGVTKLQFFIITIALSFSYYIVPNYLFPSIMALSTVCWIWKDSVTVQQLGSGLDGLGLGAFAIDWPTIVGYLGTPLQLPGFSIINMLVGYILFMYILVPICYWTNSLNAKRFPLVSLGQFAYDGTQYNVTRILNYKTFDLNYEAYENYSKIYLSIVFALRFGLSFAIAASSLVHVALFHGSEIMRNTMTSMNEKFEDLHARIMRKHYKPVPSWWFYILLVVSVGMTIASCEGFDGQLQLPWWGILFAIALGFILTMPICVISATSGLGKYLPIIPDIIIGYMMPGKPLANQVFSTITNISVAEANTILADFKIGHYIKIPPRSMFIVQIMGAMINSMTSFATLWWLFNSIDHLCDANMLPKGSPWTCPQANIAYTSNVIWGVIGPLRVFGKYGEYPKLNYFFLFGLFAPVIVWWLSLKFPDKKWIKLIYTPIIIGAAQDIGGARAVSYNSWFAVAIFFNIYVYRKYKGWWVRYNYILSAGLDAGTALLALLCFLALQSNNIYGPNWWGLDVSDHCTLASCPTAPSIEVEGCPVF